jgi:hypothetical protein
MCLPSEDLEPEDLCRGRATYREDELLRAVERSVGALNIPTLTVLGGATYLVVRGLENWKKAKDAKGKPGD